jgi:CPA2 family monovalent cation:H+ antiporter-2
MESNLLLQILVLMCAALIGGIIARRLKFQPLVGYLLAGVVTRLFLPSLIVNVEQLANFGVILLLFSIGLELSWSKLTKVFRVVVEGAIFQIIIVSFLCCAILLACKFTLLEAAVLAIGFSFSSTAVIIKLLSERGEKDTIHGEIMIGWSLVQDLAAIPIIIVLTALATSSTSIFQGIAFSVIKAVLVLGAIIVLGRIAIPRLLHMVAKAESRELFILTAVLVALGVAFLASLLGISPALGAFLAGVVISESQENHAVFAETRPLRDLFAVIFFVSMGFLVNPSIIAHNWLLVILLVVAAVVIKFLTVFILTLNLGYHGKTTLAVGIGLAQIGEFAFILFSITRGLGLISDASASIGIAVTLVSLIAAPFLYRGIIPVWQKLKNLIAKRPSWGKLFLGWDKKLYSETPALTNHIVICGYGRVGAWVGKALSSAGIPFVVIEYNQEVIHKLRAAGQIVIYGDPTLREVLQAADIVDAKVMVIAIPDALEQRAVISVAQTLAPNLKIISRAHLDEDVDKLRMLKVDKIVQPEFEASVAIVRSIFSSMGKSREEVAERLKSLRLSRATY